MSEEWLGYCDLISEKHREYMDCENWRLGEILPKFDVDSDPSVEEEKPGYCKTCLWTKLDCLCVPKDQTPDHHYASGWRDGYSAALLDLHEENRKGRVQ